VANKMNMDFFNAECGKFYHSDTPLNIPVYLDQNNNNWFSEKIKMKMCKIFQALTKRLAVFL